MSEAWSCRPCGVAKSEHHESVSKSQSERESEASSVANPKTKRQSLSALLQLRQHAQRRDLERDHHFSWIHCFMSVFSYILLLTDVPRTGLGVRNLSSYTLLEPEQLIFFGPYAYPVTRQLLKNETTTSGGSSTPFWPYKYDSTSVAMRAIATHLKIREWPACVTYKEMCDERAGIPPATLFGMIDSLIENVKTHNDTQGRPGRLSLRTQYEWSDRLHDYAFPWFFVTLKLRTVQAIHYDLAQLQAAVRGSSLCGSTTRSRRPLTCDESWTNFGRLCTPDKPYCQDVGSVHTHLPTRLQALQTKYSNHTVDFVLLEGVDDLSRSSLTLQGYRSIDFVAFARVRKCGSTSGPQDCETILVDDFRYEVVPLVTNAREWFWITGIIRGLGQFYAWMRLAFLLVGCYVARAHEPHMQQRSYVGRAALTVRTMFLLPSQVMVYGSLFPISCYLLAHLIDSAAVYEIMALPFASLMGVITLEFWELLRVCAVSMRSLWLLAFACHVIHRVVTHCAWSPIHGVPGIPEFSLSFVASLTILAQVKYPWLRHSPVTCVEELTPSPTRFLWNSIHSDASHGLIYKLLFGTVVDYKCLAVFILLYVGVVLLLRLVNTVIPRFFRYKAVLFTRTDVPYGAGSLWSDSALVVSWHGTILTKPTTKKADLRAQAPPLIQGPQYDFDDSTPIVAIGALEDRVVDLRPTTQPPVVTKTTTQSFTARFHQHLAGSHDRETLIFLMNLGVMTDPLTFFRLRVFRGKRIGVYTESKAHTRRYTTTKTKASSNGSDSSSSSSSILLPLVLATSSTDIPIDWSELKLQLVVHTSELDWCDLLQCG